MCQGTITFVSGKGWFFAENDADHSAIFVHQKDVENRRYLKVDDRISFDVIPSRSQAGQTQASNVKYLGHTIAVQRSETVRS
jgi:cold shock CspA family protein